jgi:type III pantothenate kinase
VILLRDAGNTAVKWAVLRTDGSLDALGRQVHRDSDDVVAHLSAAWRDVPPLMRAVGCAVAHASVVRDIERALALNGMPGVEWQRSQPEFTGRFSLTNGYRDPAQLGPDRWHALIGACHRLPGESIVVVNAGTATTVDCVRAEAHAARFVGGCIAPGVRLMLESLARGTAGLPLAEGEPLDFPDTTDRAIVTGVFDAQVGLIERVRARFAASLGTAPRLLMAGGHAERLADRLTSGCAPLIEHNLVLHGLALRASAP